MSGKYVVPFLTGYGDGALMLQVAYFAGGVLRNAEGVCAFCEGDPCNEYLNTENSNIAEFYRQHPKAETCPMCDGRPT